MFFADEVLDPAHQELGPILAQGHFVAAADVDDVLVGADLGRDAAPSTA
jgi:hypothetical protein